METSKKLDESRPLMLTECIHLIVKM